MKPDSRPQPFNFPDPDTGEIKETVSYRFLADRIHELCQLAHDSGFTEAQLYDLIDSAPAFTHPQEAHR